jgi:hypothetical protein
MASERDTFGVSHKSERDRYIPPWHFLPLFSTPSSHPATIGIGGVGVVDVVVVVASYQQASVGKAHTVGSLLACLSAATLLHHDAANTTPPVAATRHRWFRSSEGRDNSDKTPSFEKSSQLVESTYFRNPRNFFVSVLVLVLLCSFSFLFLHLLSFSFLLKPRWLITV